MRLRDNNRRVRNAGIADGPLRGMRVVKFRQRVAGPWVGRLLDDVGADVIKVKPPGEGDALCHRGRARHNGHSLWWSVLGRRQRLVALNLRGEAHQEAALESCAGADVVVEHSRPGTMGRWRVGADDVHPRHPECIHARISGYGQRERHRNRRGFVSDGEAIGGLPCINGSPGTPPPRMGISLGDALAARAALPGVLLALYARDARQAEGRVFDVAMTDACVAMLESA